MNNMIYEDGKPKIYAKVEGFGAVSTDNSTTTPLGISGVFTGVAEDLLDFSVINILLKTDASSATDGLSIQFSTDGTNWDEVHTFTITGGTAFEAQQKTCGRYFRIVYTNGAVAQTYFRLQVVKRKNPSTGNISENGHLESDSYIVALTQWQSYQVNIGIAAAQIDTSALVGRKTISIKANKGNTALIYIGHSSGVSTTNGYELDANEVITLEIDETATVWAIATSGTQRVSVAEIK